MQLNPPESLDLQQRVVLIIRACDVQLYTPESLDFQQRISQRNGLSEETYLSPGLKAVPPCVNMETSRQESAMVLAGAVQDALDRTGEPSACLCHFWTQPHPAA